MRTRWAVLVGATGLLLGAAACGSSPSDPASARCTDPAPTFGDPADLGDHREVAVHFTCEGAVLAGTLYLPPADGAHPAVVWVHGAGEQTRLGYGNIVAPLVQKGVAVFSYDKRGVGESDGDCCPGDESHFNLLAADADGAVAALRSRDDVDPAKVGFYGVSQAGWVVPLADARLADPVAFTALASGPAVTTGEEAVWSDAAGEDESGRLSAAQKAEAEQKIADAGPSGFDPLPYIEKMRSPGLWLFGGGDRSIPADRSAELLEKLGRADFTVKTYPGAGHGLLDTTPTAPEAPSDLVDWIVATTKAR